ncbi:MAG: aspartyl/asparaginyl beta-hydroxylase domain-containing protein [Acidimicrobiaceae bacterium]|nr:aspartyl/asparaginyl beta-hydroxylase domain-containing protein [Acidimicrobiaceae bacterium]
MTGLRSSVVGIGFKLVKAFERLVARASLVSTEPFLPAETFAWTAPLEREWRVVRSELDRLLARHDELPNFQDISVDQARISADDRWKTFFFYGYGFRSDRNCSRCPETARLLAGIPGMTTAFFSILSPGKRIPEHRGPYKGVLRYHLALQVPSPNEACGIRVGGQVAHWREGSSLLFDDTFPHEAWNDTAGVRVVLFMDIVRPLRPPVSWLNQLVIKAIALSPYVQGGKQREQEWEDRFEQAETLQPNS